MADHTPEGAIERLLELSSDVRAAVLAGPAGHLQACSESGSRADEMARLGAELFERAAALEGDPPEQVEAQVAGGAVYAVRSSSHLLAAVADRSALPSLMFCDLRAALSELDWEPA